MADRITIRHLEGLCRSINRAAGFSDDQPLWSKRSTARTANGRDLERHERQGTNVATVGMFYIDGAYGGWCLHRMQSESGGVEDIFRCGHVPARNLYERMRAFIDGYNWAFDLEYEQTNS